MEWSKIKNIILIILLTVNLFLLVLVAYREERSARYQASARENAAGVLAQNGIMVDVESLPRDTSLASLSMERDRAQEAAAAAALLGASNESGQGGTVLYTGEKGTARFSRTGDFSADLLAGAYLLEGLSEREHAIRTLALLGFEGEVLSAEEDGGKTVVAARQLWKGVPVFTCRAVLVYEDGELVSIQDGSSRLTGTPAGGGDLVNLSVVTALLRFLDGLNKLGDVCTSLTGMTPGYVFAGGYSDPITLRPVWYITTDTGAYYLDAGTGALERAG